MTTEYLLDTNACIAIRTLLAGKSPKSEALRLRVERMKERWSKVPKERVAISIITLGELLFGVAKSNNPSTARARLEALRRQVTVLPVDAPVTEHYASIRFELERRGESIGPNDTWIAAHGLASKRTLVTSDREFARVAGLAHEDWTV